MTSKLETLKSLLQEVYDLRSAKSILEWDQLTYMPTGGAIARARQGALLDRLAQEKGTNPEIGHLLDELQAYADSLPPDHDDAALIKVTRREYERTLRVPPAFIGEVSQLAAESYSVWAKARPENDFKATQPYLERILDYSRRWAEFFPGYEHIADPLIDYYDHGMKASDVRSIFAQLRRELVPIVQRILALPPADDSSLHLHFPEAGQRSFGEQVIRQLGYDFDRGREDKTRHPFTTRFSDGDVRITTRVDEHDLGDCLFSTIHEAGHALYEQGIRQELDASPLGGGTSAGIHESQSRLWENLVGRSRVFWEHFYPSLQDTFPAQLKDVSLDTFYRAVNAVKPSLIRTEADEVTYNLHVMIRFDLELDMLEGNLHVKDLPEAWNARYQADLGLHAADDRDGVLQDVHWFGGRIGGVFQGYTLGNIISAQFFSAALISQPHIPDEIRLGKFDTLRHWLTRNVYQHGSKFTTSELLQRTTGTGISIVPYINYLKTKYGALYPA